MKKKEIMESLQREKEAEENTLKYWEEHSFFFGEHKMNMEVPIAMLRMKIVTLKRVLEKLEEIQ